ncbi:ATP-binding protein [Peribacillus simplex]|uniref:ATP-binding protein n=1 Tax=Peribacillus simplex TaxID=1478 RepID=UPI00367273B3
MSFKNELENQARDQVKTNPLMQIVNESDFVGFSFDVKYQKVSLVTNDFWKMEAHGVPHNSFLIAAPFNKENYIGAEEIDQELILLRVISECKIPNEDIWLQTRVDKIKSLKDIDLDAQSNVSLDFDRYSKNEMGFTGLECRILGTFYEESGELNFGADLENYYGTKSLYIYKPKAESLQNIVNFIDPSRKKSIIDELQRNGISVQNYDSANQYEIGTIRYTSTNRMQSKVPSVNVMVNPFDFIARRTATFGMTRTGKSNTVKTLIKAISNNCESHNITLSQIVFDLNGEYAFPNVQDTSSDGRKVSISNEIPNSIVYTINSKVEESSEIKQLRFNFYNNLVLAHEFIVSLLNVSPSAKATDIETFMNMDISAWYDQDAPRNIKSRAESNKILYKYLLYLIGCHSTNIRLKIPFSKTALQGAARLINNLVGETEDEIASYESDGKRVPSKLNAKLRGLNDLLSSLQGIIDNLNSTYDSDEFGLKLAILDEVDRLVKIPSSSGGDLIKDDTANLMNIIHQKNSKNSPYLGFISIKKVQASVYHNEGSKDYIQEIINDMIAGKTIVLDISNGSQEIRDRITKKIVEKIFYHNLEEFTKGNFPPKVILYVEEAHNLIGKDMNLTDIWPRTAKEGAKYGIGLVYSTQEPSSINKNILSNTENWFVTHLNNEDEIKILSKYYDFGDFRESLLKAKDVGFARIKTMSQNFVIPVQIKKFEGGK